MTGVMKSLWASVQGNPVFMRRVNGWLTVFWVAMIPVSVVTHWISSVTYVAALSLWALVSGHWSAWQAARVEVNQEREMKARDAADLPGEVVDRIVQETDVEFPSREEGQVAAEGLPSAGDAFAEEVRVARRRPRYVFSDPSRGHRFILVDQATEDIDPANTRHLG